MNYMLIQIKKLILENKIKNVLTMLESTLAMMIFKM